jgi:hypothetical protein
MEEIEYTEYPNIPNKTRLEFGKSSRAKKRRMRRRDEVGFHQLLTETPKLFTMFFVQL